MLTRHGPKRTKYLFAGKVTEVPFDGTTLQLCVSEADLSFSTVDTNCNVRVHSLDSALAALKDVSPVTIALPDDILTNLPVTGVKVTDQARFFFQKPVRMLCLSLTGTQADRQKLKPGTPFQLYSIDEKVVCP